MTLIDIAIIYLVFTVKHLICDWFLQNSWMALNKDKPLREGGAKPLAAHAGIHAVFTFFLMLMFAPSLWWIGAVDFVVHGGIDFLKGRIVTKSGWTYASPQFWWAIGTDQEAHHLTHFFYIILIIWAHGVDFSAALALQP